MSLGGVPRGGGVSYFADLTPYSYSARFLPPGTTALNVGWLDEHHGFAKRRPSRALMGALAEALDHSTARTRGYSSCPLCWAVGDRSCPVVIELHGRSRALGDAEIWVVGSDGVLLCAPNMIVHYVQSHHYRPPKQFIEALTERRFGSASGGT